MPHVSSSGGDDLGSTDEVKVFKDEGDGEDEKRSSENLTEEKSSLIDLTESEVLILYFCLHFTCFCKSVSHHPADSVIGHLKTMDYICIHKKQNCFSHQSSKITMPGILLKKKKTDEVPTLQIKNLKTNHDIPNTACSNL